MHRWFIPSLLSVLALISIVTLKSVANSLASSQLLFYVLGVIIFIVSSQVPFRWWWVAHKWLYLLLTFLLVLTLLIGGITRGTMSWIAIGPYHIQPSQLAVPFVALSAGWFLSEYTLKTIKKLVSFLILIALPAALIVIEPDLGTTIVYLVSLGSLLLISSVPPRFLISLALIGLTGIVLAWLFFLKPYQKARITSFLNAQSQQSEAHYNAQQSLIAVGSGQWFGRGIGQGSQSHLRFLPERQTDFIFASFAEEWGLIGSLILVGLYLALTCYLLYVYYYARSPFEQFFCFAIALMIGFQSIVNIGMNIGLLPITGVTLPFVSYGGSSLLSLMFALGLCYNVARRLPPPLLTRHFN